jgi:hypothetical protein
MAGLCCKLSLQGSIEAYNKEEFKKRENIYLKFDANGKVKSQRCNACWRLLRTNNIIGEKKKDSNFRVLV